MTALPNSPSSTTAHPSSALPLLRTKHPALGHYPDPLRTSQRDHTRDHSPRKQGYNATANRASRRLRVGVVIPSELPPERNLIHNGARTIIRELMSSHATNQQ